MKSQRPACRLVALLGIGVCVFAAPALAQDCPEPVGSWDTPRWTTDVAGATAQADAADGEDLEGDAETPACAGMALNPQLVIWTDALINILGGAAHNTAHDEFMVGWATVQDQWSIDVWARRLRPDGTLLEHFNIANAAGEQLVEPKIVYCPLRDEYLMAYTNWYDYTSGRADVQARRVAWNGGWMGDIFTITPELAQHIEPSIAYCGPCDEYVVTYTNQWPGGEIDLYAQRVRAADGALLDMNYVASGGGWNRAFSGVAFHPQTYGGAGGYLIGYLAIAASPPVEGRVRYKMSHTDLYDLYANPELDISSTSLAEKGPEVAAGQTGFLAAWWEQTTSGYQVKARRISADGVTLGPPEGFPVSGVYVAGPSILFDLAVTYAYPGLYLVFWEHETPSGVIEIHGIFVSEDADATVGDEVVLSGSGTNMSGPAATCSPMSDCLIVYNWENPPSFDIAGDIARLVVMSSDGFESGNTSAWSATVP